MKTRFLLIVVLLSLVLAAWTYIQYEFGVDKQARLRQLGRVPVYIYLADSTKVASIKQQLEQVPNLESVSAETGQQAANELIKAYQLPISESMLQDYRFPAIITVKFKPLTASLRSHQQVAGIITRNEIPMNDVDLQSNAWDLLSTELGSLNRRWLVVTVFITLMVCLIMIFIRLSFELRWLLLQKRKLVSVVDALRFSTLSHRHTLMLLLIPMLASWWLYYLFSNAGVIEAVIPLWFFGIQLGALIGGSLVISIILHRYTYNRNLRQAIESEEDLA
jgi:hypothetical protein